MKNCYFSKSVTQVLNLKLSPQFIFKELFRLRDFKPLGFCSFQYYNGSLFSDNPQTMECSMLCMIGVPSLVTLQELIKFVSPHSSTIDWMKIVRDQMPNQYMVIIGFKSHVCFSLKLIFTSALFYTIEEVTLYF